jgi:hypothetical protein
MRRLRALGYSLFVAAAVFIYLALPTLREMYGQVVDLPVYAFVALTAGGLTWVLLAGSARRSTDHEVPTGEDDVDVETEANVDEELATLKEET